MSAPDIFAEAVLRQKPPPQGAAAPAALLPMEDAPERPGVQVDLERLARDIGLPDEVTFPAEGQTFIIDYTDSAGQRSTRRISAWSITINSNGVPNLVAKCHERNATRSFRLDRIAAVYDLDGVSQEPLDQFYFDTFHILWSPASAPVPPFRPQSRMAEIREVCRNTGVPALVAVALADGEMADREFDLIMSYAARYVAAAGITLFGTDAHEMKRFVKTMRPPAPAIERALRAVTAGPETIAVDFAQTAAAIAMADQKVTGSEAELLRRFQAALLARSSTAP